MAILIRNDVVLLPIRVEDLEAKIAECEKYPESIVWKFRDFLERAQAQVEQRVD